MIVPDLIKAVKAGQEKARLEIQGKHCMNERIKLLAIIANPSSQEIYESDSWQFNCAAWSAEDLEKFAELIVRECCDWIDGSPSTDAGQLLLTKSFIIANLKGHFGVEE